MRKLALGGTVSLIGATVLPGMLLFSRTACAALPSTETILFVRHGEKSPDGFGQLSCKGRNRAHALTGVIQRRFGKLDAVFAPDPSQQKPDGALSYDYVRPLATVEPTAIRFGLPVHAAIGYSEADKLLAALQVPAYRDANILVAWEHHQLNTLVPRLIKSLGGDAGAVPKWSGEDYDSIWRVTISRSADGRTAAAFAGEHEGLDGEPDACPG